MSLTCRYLYRRNKQSPHQNKCLDLRNHHLNNNLNYLNKIYAKQNIQILPPIQQYQRHQSYSFEKDSQIISILHQKHPYLDNVKQKQKLKTNISQHTELEVRLSLQIRRATIKDLNFSGQTNQSNIIVKKEEKLLTLDNLSNSFNQKKQKSTKKYYDDVQKTTKITDQSLCGWLQFTNDEI